MKRGQTSSSVIEPFIQKEIYIQFKATGNGAGISQNLISAPPLIQFSNPPPSLFSRSDWLPILL